jgi:hypothetical protein
MSAETASKTATARLRRNVLDLPQVVFQGITHIAPSINIVFTFPIIALKAGPTMPISFFLTTIVCFFIGNTVSQFSKYMPSSGDPMSAALGYWGSNIARGGFLAGGAADLPGGASDYVERLVAPYFTCACEWYETIGIGITGGELYDLVHRRLGDPFFGVHLNPGHFIHLDEWPSSPVCPGSEVTPRSGMTLQLDIIPATGSAYHTTNIEDGVALADDAARAELAARYPEAWDRICRRRDFMAGQLGIRLKPEVLPLSNLAGYLPPYWLAPNLAMRKA